MEEKQDFIIYANNNKMMICFDVLEKDVKNSVAHYNKLGKITKTNYTYHKCKVESLKVLD